MHQQFVPPWQSCENYLICEQAQRKFKFKRLRGHFLLCYCAKPEYYWCLKMQYMNSMAGNHSGEADVPSWCGSDRLRRSAGPEHSPAFLLHWPERGRSAPPPPLHPQQLLQQAAPPHSLKEGGAR